MRYILGIDQSTQGTKAILVDAAGALIGRADRPHAQIVNEVGWVSHDLDEIWRNTIAVARDVVAACGIDPADIGAVGISNQRETGAMWRADGTPLNLAVVWQCARGKDIAARLQDRAGEIERRTGLRLSPYFTAAKFAWLLENTRFPAGMDPAEIRLGTIDSWLVYRMTGGRSFRTDCSNASRTQLFNIRDLRWDEEICRWFGIPAASLPEVCDSNADFGATDLEGLLPAPVPIRGVMGDSHAALYGQGCHEPGMVKATYGTGSSIMMNTGRRAVESRNGLVTSLAWGIDGEVSYVMEGNINYSGAVVTWLKDQVRLIDSAAETSALAEQANPQDRTVLIPAFSGLGAPYWNDGVSARLTGMSRTTGRNEIVKAALDSIAFQINAVVTIMSEESSYPLRELRVDGGATRNDYLMQFQSDLCAADIRISGVEELSAIGAAYMAGQAAGLCDRETLFRGRSFRMVHPRMPAEERSRRLALWNEAVRDLLGAAP